MRWSNSIIRTTPSVSQTWMRHSDLLPVFRTIGSWKIPVMMGGPEREDDDEDVEVQRGTDRLHSAAG